MKIHLVTAELFIPCRWMVGQTWWS